MAPIVKGELSDSEQKLMDAALRGTIQEISSLLREPDVHVDCLDKSGMTPLQHACFKGRPDVVRFLLENGADVNANYHENSYSTLHFAALSGNVEVTNLVLEAGARTDEVNSVNRTATQMAAFVGQHQCVRAINNFFPRYELEKFTIPTGFEKEPKLPPALLQSLLQLINMTNLNPVRLAMYLKDHSELVQESYKVCKVLDIIVERNMKSRDTNDVQAIKCHYYASLIRLAKKAMKNSEDTVDSFIKSLVKGREQDGFPEMQDRVIRQALKEFPYPESQLLQTLVQQIAPVKIGDGMSALSTLVSGMYGPSFDDETACTTCGDPNASKTCAACKCTKYCNQTCQKLHWPTHKKFCKKLGEQFQRMEAERLKAEEKDKEKRMEAERLKVEEKDKEKRIEAERLKAEEDKEKRMEAEQLKAEEKDKEEMEAKMKAHLADNKTGEEADDSSKDGPTTEKGDNLTVLASPAAPAEDTMKEKMCDAGENGLSES